MKKWILILILSLGLLLGVSGCMSEDRQSTAGQGEKKPNVNEEALAYLEQKYGEPFEYAAPWGNSMSGTRQFLATCASLEDERVFVEIADYKKDNRTFSDNYIAVKYRRETIDFFQRCTDEAYGGGRVFYDVRKAGLSSGLSAGASFEEFLADGQVPFIMTVEVKESAGASEELMEKAAELIAASGAEFYLTVVVTSDAEFGTGDSEDVRDRIFRREFVQCAEVTHINGITQVRWYGKE